MGQECGWCCAQIWHEDVEQDVAWQHGAGMQHGDVELGHGMEMLSWDRNMAGGDGDGTCMGA